MELSENAKVIEVILFVENRPITFEKLQKMSRLESAALTEALDELGKEFTTRHGLFLEHSEEGYSFTPCTELHDRLRKVYGKRVDSRLSNAALETLSIIAYSQPITRSAIDEIRGHDSSNIIKILRERDLIKKSGYDMDAPGHPTLYRTTQKFLFEFNLNSIANLPQLEPEESERFEQKDEDGNVLSGRQIKKELKG